MAEMTSHSQECSQECFTPYLSCAAESAAGWESPHPAASLGFLLGTLGLECSRSGLAMIPAGFARRQQIPAVTGSGGFSSLGSQSTVTPTARANITHAQVSRSS